MSMTKDEWQHRRESMEYIESNRQYQTEKRLLDAIGRTRGWLTEPKQPVTWQQVRTALIRKLIREGELRNAAGELRLDFNDVTGAIRRDQEWLPSAINNAKSTDYRTAGLSLQDAIFGCAGKLIDEQRWHFDEEFKGAPDDEAFHQYLSEDAA